MHSYGSEIQTPCGKRTCNDKIVSQHSAKENILSLQIKVKCKDMGFYEDIITVSRSAA